MKRDALGPGNIHGEGIPVFFGSHDAGVGRFGTTGFIEQFDGGFKGAIRGEDKLPIVADPGFEDIRHRIGFIARAKVEGGPGDSDRIAYAGSGDVGEGGVVRGPGEDNVDILRRDGKNIAFDVHQIGFDPTRVVAPYRLDEHPIARIGTADDFEVTAPDETIFVQIHPSRPVTAVGVFG